MSRQRHWCFTLNNYTEDERTAILAWECTYVIIGREVGESGTPHLQGYVRFPAAKRLSSMKKLSPRAHWEAAKGSPAQNRIYCSKDGDYEERGEIPKTSGEATKQKYEHAWQMAKQGNLDDICAELRIKHYRTLQKIAMDHMTALPSRDECTGMWIHGPSGTGKSTLARSFSDNYYLKACNKWWDGYQGEDYVIIEDIGPEHACLGHHLKLWCDKWDFIAECKGSSIRIRPPHIIITSQYSIEDIFIDQQTRAALTRRCEVKLVDRE